MTRKEFIADTAARCLSYHASTISAQNAVAWGVALADLLEQRGEAPWRTLASRPDCFPQAVLSGRIRVRWDDAWVVPIEQIDAVLTVHAGGRAPQSWSIRLRCNTLPSNDQHEHLLDQVFGTQSLLLEFREANGPRTYHGKALVTHTARDEHETAWQFSGVGTLRELTPSERDGYPW